MAVCAGFVFTPVLTGNGKLIDMLSSATSPAVTCILCVCVPQAARSRDGASVGPHGDGKPRASGCGRAEAAAGGGGAAATTRPQEQEARGAQPETTE